MPILCEQLAERLLNEGDNSQDNIQNAILCYICAGNIEKLVEIWPKPNSGSGETNAKHSRDLQELIEVVMMLQKAIELQGRNVGVSGKLADILSRYAGLLAAQGALSSAVTYLGPSDDANVEDLRSRLYYSLGYKQAYATPVAPTKQQFNQQANQLRSQPRHSLTNNQVPMPVQPIFNPNLPTQNTSPFTAGFGSQQPTIPPVTQQWATSPPGNQQWNNFQNPSQSPLVPNTVQTKPPQVPPPVHDFSTQQPARPSSVGSQQGSAAPRKYLLDPSVQSGQSYGQSNMYTPPMNTNFGNNFGPAPVTNFAPINPPNQPNQFTPFVPAPTNNNFMSGVPPIEMAQQAMSQKNPTPPPGWNDPPPLKTKSQPVS